MITWLSKESDDDGIATFYPNYIMFNVNASSHLRGSYRIRVGVDDNRNIIIKPLNKELSTRGDIPLDSLYTLEERPSYCRLSSALLLRQLGEKIGLKLENCHLRFQTRFDSIDGQLVIQTSKGEVK